MAREQVRVGSGDVVATVLPELGARLHRLTLLGHDLVRTPPQFDEHARDPFYWGGFVMAPWCNRITPGPIELFGRTLDVPPNFKDGTAIHGQVYVDPWQQTADGRFRIDRERDGWPWRYRVEVGFRVDGRHLVVEQALHNRDDVTMPGGIGIHPWFIGRIEIEINADHVFASNQDSSAEPEPVSGDFDLRKPRELAIGVDAAWPDVREPQVVMTWPELGVRAEMRVEAPEIHIVAARPADVDAIALEPETHAPQGLRRLVNGEQGGLALIPAGESLRLVTRYSFSEVR